MTKEETMKISEAEWEVMRVVWTLGEVDAQTISETLSHRMQWKLATIKTLLGRLVKKEALRTQQVGKKFLYSANVSEEETFRSAQVELFSHLCARRVGKQLNQMIDEVPLTQADIDQIRQTLDKKVATKVIPCDCLPGQCHCHHAAESFE